MIKLFFTAMSVTATLRLAYSMAVNKTSLIWDVVMFGFLTTPTNKETNVSKLNVQKPNVFLAQHISVQNSTLVGNPYFKYEPQCQMALYSTRILRGCVPMWRDRGMSERLMITSGRLWALSSR